MAIIRESEKLGNTMYFLDTLTSLDETTFSPQLVNVVNNARLDKDLVQLESFIRFAKENGYNDAGETLHIVCEANGVPETHRNTIGFVVKEESVIADAEVYETMEQFMEMGLPVYVTRIPSVSPYYTKLSEALALDEDAVDFDDCVNLQAYINESIYEDVKDKVSSGYESAKKKISSGYDTVKGKISGGINEISKKMASVRKKISEKSDEFSKAVGSAKVAVGRQIDKLKATYNSLKKKLIELKDAAGQKISGGIKSVKKTASDVGDWASDKYDSAKKTVSSGIDSFKEKIGMGKKK